MVSVEPRNRFVEVAQLHHQRRQRLAHFKRDCLVAGLDQLGQFAGMSGPCAAITPTSVKMAAQAVEQLRSLRNQHLARLVTHQRGLVLTERTPTKRIEGRVTASQIAAASAASFFCRRT